MKTAVPSRTRVRMPRRAAGLWLAHLFLLALSFATLAPFIWTLVQSLRPGTVDVLWTTHNYNQIVGYEPFTTSYVHSILVALAVTASAIVTSIPVGFVLSKYRFPGREPIALLMIAFLMIPFSVILVPVYVTVVHLGFDDNLAGLIVAGLWSPFGIFTARQFMDGIPSELLDAARIDGASELRIILQLMVPLCSSALTVLAVYTFMHTWDDYLLPVLLLRHPGNWTLPVLLSSGLGASTPVVSAVVVLATLPTLVIAFVTMRYFVRGISVISVDG